MIGEEARTLQVRLQPVGTVLMAVALALSPAYVVRPHVGPVPTTVLEIALVVAVLTGLYTFWNELPWRNAYTLPVLVLMAAATIDTVVSPDHRAAAGIWKAYFVEPAAAGLVIAAIAAQRDRARLLLAGLGVAGTVVALVNIAVAGNALLVTHRFNVVTPPVAIYDTANAVALYLEPLVAFALAIVFLSQQRLDRTLATAFAVVAALAIFLSYSRGGWVTLAALVIFTGLFTRWRGWLAAAVVALGAALFAGSHRVRQRVLVEFDLHSKNNTIGTRVPLWKSALAMLRHHPIFGGGLSGFKQSVQPYRDPAYHENLIYPHNLVLNFWTETGLLGLAAFIWLLVQMVRVAVRGLRLSQPWPRAMAVGLMGVVVAFLLHGMVDVPYFKNDLALAYWALLGIQLGSLITTPRNP